MIRTHHQGFTLLEVLITAGITGILLTLLMPVFGAIHFGHSLTKASAEIHDTLEEARALAMTENTYVLIGFLEENASKPSPAPAHGASDRGRIIVSVVRSRDGTKPHLDVTQSGANTPLDGARLAQVRPLLKLENVHLAALNQPSKAGPERPDVEPAYQLGSPEFEKWAMHLDPAAPPKTSFQYPLTGKANYTFSKIIEFNPEGSPVKIMGSPAQWMEIALLPARGNQIVSNGNMAILQIAGITGKTQLFRP
jgi:prepilin-type N-terminal cleavage/methylation domain-containing protein